MVPHRPACLIILENAGEVTEWLKVHAWNACVRQRTVGSNPTFSARYFTV